MLFTFLLSESGDIFGESPNWIQSFIFDATGRRGGWLRLGAGGGLAGKGGVEEAVKGGAADTEHVGGADLVAAGAGEDAGDVAKDGAVEVGIV